MWAMLASCTLYGQAHWPLFFCRVVNPLSALAQKVFPLLVIFGNWVLECVYMLARPAEGVINVQISHRFE